MRKEKSKIVNFCKRKIAKYANRRVRQIRNPKPIVTFTFDDFPRSSYLEGGKILQKYEFKATYYVSFGLMQRNLPVGEAFYLEDVVNLIKDGHETGCHTFDHLESWSTNGNSFKNSIERNLQTYKQLFPDKRFKSFSYPISMPNPTNKRNAGKYFDSCRGGGQIYNAGYVDLNLLKSYFIGRKNSKSTDELKAIIDENIRENGWLIISTHDINKDHSDFGCSPEYFTEIVNYIARKKIGVLKICDVIDRYCKK